MSTTLHSFIDIFDSYFGKGEDRIQLKKIAIPIIQRDYAQGRENDDVNRVRQRFLESLNTAVTEKPITLDFVYGDIDIDGVMTPLDGQQRLTSQTFVKVTILNRNESNVCKALFYVI